MCSWLRVERQYCSCKHLITWSGLSVCLSVSQSVCLSVCASVRVYVSTQDNPTRSVRIRTKFFSFCFFGRLLKLDELFKIGSLFDSWEGSRGSIFVLLMYADTVWHTDSKYGTITQQWERKGIYGCDHTHGKMYQCLERSIEHGPTNFGAHNPTSIFSGSGNFSASLFHKIINDAQKLKA